MMRFTNAGLAGVVATVLMTAAAPQASAEIEGYWTGTDGKVVRDGWGGCWRNRYWKPENQIEECGGKPADSDGDGVPDKNDQCPNTPAGAKVDAKGCPLDSDGDGVFDYQDRCPGTPAGVKVDGKGCPLDSDGDGVPNYKDLCPNTPAGAKVTANGCGVDSDGDGVPDFRDACPDTPAGERVNNDGCTAKIAISGEVLFATNSSEVRSAAYPVLDAAYSKLQKSSAKLRITGHTDSRGSEAYNQALSERRAKAVKQYLVGKGAKASNLEAVGKGESDPVADNLTKEGRALNRRVDFEALY